MRMLTWEGITSELSELMGVGISCARGPFGLERTENGYTATFPDSPCNGLLAAAVVMRIGERLAGEARIPGWREKLEEFCMNLMGGKCCCKS